MNSLPCPLMLCKVVFECGVAQCYDRKQFSQLPLFSPPQASGSLPWPTHNWARRNPRTFSGVYAIGQLQHRNPALLRNNMGAVAYDKNAPPQSNRLGTNEKINALHLVRTVRCTRRSK